MRKALGRVILVLGVGGLGARRRGLDGHTNLEQRDNIVG